MKKQKFLVVFFMFFFAMAANAQMVLEYDLMYANTQIVLPLSGTVNVVVDWGDGSALESDFFAGDPTHIYASGGIKTVTITGTVTWFGGFSTSFNTGIERLTRVLSWDGVGLVRLAGAFSGATQLYEVPSTLPSTVTDLSGMFQNTEIFNGQIGNWNTSAVMDMSYMFNNAVGFNRYLYWNTASVTDMTGMFWKASRFNSPIDSWNTSSVKSMAVMFSESAFNQTIEHWNTSSVTVMVGMFSGATAFNQPIGNWNTGAVTHMTGMFAGATSFNQPIGNWNTSSVKVMANMFSGATVFNQSIGNWNTSAVTDMSGMFSGATAFNQQIDTWNTGTVTNMSGMFSAAKTYNTSIGNLNTSNVSDMSSMFSGATAFNQPIENWNTAKVTNMSGMFSYAPSFNQPIGTWNTGAVTNMSGMFKCDMFQLGFFNKPLGDWNTASVTNMSGMFYGCKTFNQPLDTWNTSSVSDMNNMFAYSPAFNQPIGSWDVSAVKNMQSMFLRASVFDQPLNNWNVSAVTNMSSMFYDAFAFNRPIGNWNTSSVTNMSSMFGYNSNTTPAFNQSLGNWNISAVTNMSSMLPSLCTDNYDATLIGWSTQTVKTGVILHSGISKYSALSTNARAALISKGWTIYDAGLGVTGDLKCRNTQTITFDALPIKVLADASFVLAATASSGLPITYTSSNTAVATISGNVVTILGVGVTTITATQAGDANYKPAVNVIQLLTVQPKILLSYNIIRGTIYTDGNSDCVKQTSEKPLSSIVVKAMPGNFYGYTDRNGDYEIRVDTGTISYTLTQQYNAESTTVLVNQCASSHSVSLKGASIDTASFDFANEVRACTLPTVNIQHTQLIRCFKSSAYIQYCNLGNAIMTNAVIKVEYPQHVIPISSVPMWSSKVGSTLFYDLATLQETNCGRIEIIDSVDCFSQSILGLTQCIKATIAPMSTCTSSSSLWDFSSTAVVGTCENNQAKFVLTNNGDGDMSDSLTYRIFVNDTLIYNGKYKLLSGSTLNVRYPAQAQTVRLEADQHPNHPGNSHPKAVIESCGVSSTGFVPKELVTTTALDDLDEEISIVCYPIRGSFDPNDKQASPKGIGLINQVAPGTELEYTIRFQNTGTSMAYTVKIVDTLDADLDVTSFIQSVSSHPYTLAISGKGQAVLTFTFDNINLPDSTADKLASNGLVSFRITIPSDISIGKVIDNKAYIYFDYNDPIITNNTMHTVGISTNENLTKGNAVSVENITTGLLYNQYSNAVKIYPNPSEGIITIELAEVSSNMELRITSVLGVHHKTVKLVNTTKQQVHLEGIRQGMYLYEILKDGERSSVGTLQIW